MAAPLPSHASLFTEGPLLAAVQSSRVFEDSKTFVDCPCVTSAAAVASAFAALEAAHAPARPPRAALAELVAAHFGAPGAELAPAPPPGYQATLPSWADALPPDAAALARAVHSRWPLLGRVSAASVAHAAAHPAPNEAAAAVDAGGLPLLRTALPLPHACVVPGDRFREVYYWDTYWVVRGLLASGMSGAAEGAARNLLALAAATAPSGHVPNGARTYYLRRSQPPLLARTLAAVAEALSAEAGDALLRDAMPTLRAELRYWSTGSHGVRVRDAAGRVHAVSRYWAPGAPRPESWREDVAAAEGLPDAAARALWRDIAAAAESGWDFSTRWLRCEGGDSDGDDDAAPQPLPPPPEAAAASLRLLRTTRVVPADLNALLLHAARLAAGFARRLQDHAAAEEFDAAAAQRQDALDALLWDDAGAQWRDLILDAVPDGGDEDGDESPIRTGRLSRRAFASNWIPLWCGAAPAGSARAAAAAASLLRSGLVLPGGVVASLSHSGLQWDFPNAWPPLQHALVEALHDAAGAHAPARAIARAFLTAAAAGLRLDGDASSPSGEMHEKYDARYRAAGAPGGGGEYAPQVGFGWSNGAALDLLKRFGGIPADDAE